MALLVASNICATVLVLSHLICRFLASGPGQKGSDPILSSALAAR